MSTAAWQGPRRARTASLALALAACACGRADAQTLAPPAAPFAVAHAAAVDSGLLSLLGTFTTTRASAAPTLRFPMFDPSVGRLAGVAVTVTTGTSTFTVAPSGVLSLVSFASASRTLGYTVTAGATSAGDGTTRLDAGGVLLTLFGLGATDIGGAQLAKTTRFAAPVDLANFVGAGSVAVDVVATDTLTVSTLLSLLNGAGFSGSGQASGTVQLAYTYAPYPGGNQLGMAKSASVSSASRGDTITYTLVFTNQGISPISALAIQDATPTFTTFQSARALAVPDGMPIATATAPSAGTTGALTWNFTGPLAPAATGTVQYTVVVD